MRVSNIFGFVALTSVTTCLFTVMGHQPNAMNNIELNNELMQYEAQIKNSLPLDSPVDPVDPDDLPFKFKDNSGKPPQYDPKSKLYLEQPSNIKTNVEYDQANKRYEVSQTVGDKIDYRPDTWMSQKEYENYAFKKAVRDYWRSRVAADELNSQPRKSMVPKLEVNSDLFDRIFGGNTVDIKPTGTAELIFGLQRNKTLNPAIPQRQQKITNFDFNMRIQLNLIGKIGDKLKITTNYNTEASFDWENQIKLDYTGYEDEIIKKIEAGNVTLPLNSTLITGSQTLFGFKTKLQFGKLDVTTVFSQQRGKKTEINVQGGAQVQAFTVNGDNYESNKHFFLGHFFRRNYDGWMATLPVIQTPVVITKVEVYILNQTGSAEQTRNVVAFEDLGEDKRDVYPGLRDSLLASTYAITDAPDIFPSNDANNLYSIITNSVNGLLKDRDASKTAGILPVSSIVTNTNNPNNSYMVQARDYDIIYNARRLNPQEFFINTRTGFISLNQTLNNDQVLAVSYQYTYNGKLYQVGEFSEQFPDNSKMLVCKLLKGSVVNTRFPLWRLMMKNVYSIGAFNVNPQDFILGLYYNNIETGVDVPYIPHGVINGQQLIRVLNCDKLSVNGDRVPDGVFDFIKDFTINPNNGRIYLPMAEPFGSGLKGKFDINADFPGANKYLFTELYDSTRTAATFIQEKNRYKIKGSFKSAAGSEISLNALNIPQGAVLVTANGVPLTENSDYTVDYTLGRVKIINESLLNSGANIKVSLESNSLFNVQQKSLIGTRLDYKAGRNLSLGSTIMRFSERPITQKVSLGDEPVRNTIIGLDYNYKTDLPFLTRLLDKLPLYSTKEMSSLTTRGEVAKLFPGNAKAIGKSGNSYIDDFEGSISLIDIRSPFPWILASIPQGQNALFPEAKETSTITPGINRARFNWYTIDQMYTRNQTGSNNTPSYYDNNVFSNNMWRQVFETELFPGKTPPNGQQQILQVLDLGFFPNQRGQYNYDVLPTSKSAGVDANGLLLKPETRWGGIMRRLETNDFQAANIEYIQFWLMDPFNEDYDVKTDPDFDKTQYPDGDLYINIGNVSEDIVKDGQMTYENGLPGQSNTTKDLPVNFTGIANVPSIPPTVNAFSQDNADRPFQDVGYDGMKDSAEVRVFQNEVSVISGAGFNQGAQAVIDFKNDPSSDNFIYHRDESFDPGQDKTIKRYSKYTNPENNTPVTASDGGTPRAYGVQSPNIEDVNRDNTLSETESYYQYRIHISKSDVNPNSIGTNYIVDAFDGTAEFSGIKKVVKWYQFKIPINQFEAAVGGIEGFNSIRFMRVYMKGFERPVLLRMARFELVRSDWRRYQYDLKKPGEFIKTDDQSTSFDVSAVSLQENGTKVPVNYVMPPEIQQQQNIQTTNLVLQNEQSLQMRVCNLKDGDSRGVFKNVDLDTRMFKNIKMNVHAEAMSGIPLNDNDLHLFVRIGSDYNNNYYEYELPLKLTPKGSYDANNEDARRIVWPAENEVNIKFDEISLAKDARNTKYGYFSNLNQLTQPFTYSDGLPGYSITVVGNPNLGNVKSIMIGVRNPKDPGNLPHCVEVWVNELRLTEFNNKGGWAATGQMQLKMADLGNASLAGTYYSPFYGGVEQKINERRKESTFLWDMSSSINAGKFFPTNWKVTLPVYYNYGQTIITPLFNPIDPDVRMDAFKENPNISSEKKDEILDQVLDYTERKGFNLTNVRVDGFKRKGAKPMPWDISNFAVTYAYTETFKRNINIETSIVKQYRGNFTYQYSMQKPPAIKPFAKTKIFQNKWFALIKDFNLQLLPNSFGAGVDVNRNFSVLKNRDITSFYAGNVDFFNPSLYNKNFLINRNYNLRWDLSKSLKFDFSANNEGRIFEPQGEVGKLYQPKRDSIINTFMKGQETEYGKLYKGTSQESDKYHKFKEGKYGANLAYRQQMNLNFNVPLSKFPLLDFMTVSYKFGGTYTWNRAPFGTPMDSMYIGNTINNTTQHNLTGSFAMTTLYNKIPYFKRINTGQNKNSKPTVSAKKSNVPLTDSTNPKKNENFKEIAEFLARGIMMVKNISLTYQEQRGQGLPNFMPRSNLLGMDQSNSSAPGFLFTTGLYDPTIRETSAKNGWLAKVPNQTTPYVLTESKSITYRSSIEPHGSLKIELTGNYTKAKNLTEFMVYDTTGHYFTSTNDFNFHQSTNESGNFNITTFSFFQSLRDAKPSLESVLFQEFKLERDNVARELAEQNPNNASNLITSTVLVGSTTQSISTWDGYSPNQQDVLIGAFYRTYTGQKIKNYNTKNIFPTIPMPNWTVSWDGLGKIKGLQKTFRSITIRHGYRSTYNIAGYSNNLLYSEQQGYQNSRSPVADPVTGIANFNPKYTINAVTITEGFTPLIKFDLQFQKPGWQANAEMKRDKTISLNITGPQIIETKGQEYIVGLGYRYPNLSFKKLTIGGKPLKSDLTVKMDFSYRKNLSVIRRIADDISVPTGGTNIITLRSSADYLLTPNINLRLYFDWIRTKPQTSASFPTANTSGGFSLRINFQ